MNRPEDGNSDRYAVEKVRKLERSPLEGMHICYLGSSVTLGAASLETSFVQYIAKRDGTTYVKEAVSGTTLVDDGPDSYISRLKTIDRNEKFDLFVCQLSTNDASQGRALGKVSAEGTTSFDIGTVCGAIEYIITYVRRTWKCPVVFYTNAWFESDAYSKMVQALYEIRDKYGIGIIDLYTDRAFNAITDTERNLYMADAVHPKKAGYLLWWTPKFEEVLYQLFR